MGSVRRRHGGDSGSWEARYRDALGKQRTKGGFPTKTAAEHYLTTVEADLLRRVVDGDPRRGSERFESVARRWLRSKEATLRPKTFASYRGKLERLVLPRFGEARVRFIDHDAVQDFVDDLGERYSGSTVRQVHNVLRQIMGSAVRRGMIPVNPCGDVELPPLGRAAEPCFLTAGQVVQLAGLIDGSRGLYVKVAAFTGLRAGEMAGLRVGDLDRDSGRLTVRRTMTEINGVLHEGPTKNRRVRAVGVPQSLLPEIDGHLESVYPAGPAATDPLFPGEGGGAFRHSNFMSRHFRPAVDHLVDAGLWPAHLRRLRYHDLRHTCAALLIGTGAHPKAIADRLGHSTIAVTMDHYGHLFDSLDRELTDALDALVAEEA